MFHATVEAEAKNNLRSLYRSLQEQDSGSDYPARWYHGIRAAIRDPAASAEQSGPASEDRYFAEAIRHRLYDSYKILSTIRGDRVHVPHIRRQVQDPEDLFGRSDP